MQPSPQFTPPGGASSGQGSGVWIFVGCGLLLLLTLCAGSGGLIYYAMNQGAAAGFGPTAPTGAPVPTPTPSMPAPTGTPLPSRTVQATVTQAIGNSPAPVNATCNFVVTAVAEATTPPSVTCRAQVVCGGQLLYGGPTAGYFPCTVSDQPPTIIGRDDNTTSSDSDAAITLDSSAGQLLVHDDAGGPHGAFSITARIDSVL